MYALKTIFPMLICLASFAEKIVINAEDDWAPYSVASSDKKDAKGLSPDLVRAAFKSQKVDVEFHSLPFARCIQTVLDGESLACFDSVLDAKTKENFIHHQTPLFKVESAIWALKSSKQENMKVADLEGEIVGTTNGYQYPDSFSNNPKIKKTITSSELSTLKMLLHARFKYGIVYEMPGYFLLNEDPELKGKLKIVGSISTDSVFVSFSKKHPDGAKYAKIFEKGMQTIKNNGSYDKILEAFMTNLKAKP